VVGLSFLTWVGVGLFWPQQAMAKSSFLETVGVSTAVGSVLGASTLPFFESPGKNLSIVAVGSLVGLGVGLGIAVYQWASGGSESSSRQQAIFQDQPIRDPGLEDDLERSYFSRGQTSLSLWLPVVSVNL